MLLRGITAFSLLLGSSIVALFDMALWLLPVMFAALWLGAVLLAFVFLCVICAFVDLEKPQETDSRFYRFFMYLYIEALMSLVRLETETAGLEKTPKQGRFLLVCNHQNESDPGILMHYFKGSQLAFISKKENATMFAVGKFMHKTLCPMIDRENDREALKTILKCIRMIKEDLVSVAVFPEGGIKVYGKLSHFRPGVFKIAQKAEVPIVVCTLKGTDKLFENMRRLKRTKVRLHLVDVIPAEELKGHTTVDIADRVYRMMLADLGPEYEIENTEST